MEKKNFIEENRIESDQLIYKALVMGSIVMTINFIVLLLRGKVDDIYSVLPGIGILVPIIPIIYYKKSEKKEHFYIIAIVAVEILSAILFMACWLYAGLMWVFSFLMVCLYFDVPVMKKIFAIKIPVMIVFNIWAIKARPNYAIEATLETGVNIIIYYLFQIIIIGYLFVVITKKTNTIFSKSIAQSERITDMYAQNVEGSQAINATINELYHDINTSMAAINEVSNTSIEIASKSGDLVKKAETGEQSVEDMVAKLDSTAENSRQIEELTNKMSDVTKVNQNNIAQLFDKIQEIEQSNLKSKEEFSRFVESSARISKAVEIIDEVSNETNLLALNASIEAARAGDAGRGFAVVASEIGKLANQSAASATDINAILSEMTSNTKQSISSMNEMQKIISENLAMVNETRDDFKRMFSIQEDVVSRINELRDFMKDVKGSVAEVKMIIEETKHDCNENAGDVQEISAVLEQLNSSFQNIERYAKEVHESSVGLINSMVVEN